MMDRHSIRSCAPLLVYPSFQPVPPSFRFFAFCLPICFRPHSLSVCVSVPSVCLAVLFICLHPQSLSVSFHLCVFDHPSICLSLPSVCLPSYLSLTIYSVCVSAYNSVSLIIGLSSCLSLLSVCRPICHHPHILLSVHKSMRLATCLRQHRCQEDPEFPIQFPFLTVSSHKTPKERLIEENYLPWKQKSGRCMVCSHKQYLQ